MLSDEKTMSEKGMQELLAEISRRYAGKCFYKSKELGLYPGQIPILAILSKKDGYSQREIVKLLGVKPPTVTVSIQRLEKSGILCRKQDENDQRVTRIYLTEKGRGTIQKGMRFMEEMEQAVFGSFSDTELCLMRRFFMQILENIEAIPSPHQEKENGTAEAPCLHFSE